VTTARSALILSGGPHPFAETTPLLEALLAGAGYDVQVVESPSKAAMTLEAADPDLWVCNTLRWRMLAPKYDDTREEFAYEIDADSARRIEAWVTGGGRVLALHAAPICFDNWDGWGELIGARWDWDRSWHPPVGEIRVELVAEHQLTEGLDDFTVLDEAYRDMWVAADVEPLAVSRCDDQVHPVLWVREVGDGVVVTSTLGHGPESFRHPTHRRLLERAIDLLGGRPGADRPRDSGSPMPENHSPNGATP
jgi:type 1 glutamine amidotransferase